MIDVIIQKMTVLFEAFMELDPMYQVLVGISALASIGAVKTFWKMITPARWGASKVLHGGGSLLYTPKTMKEESSNKLKARKFRFPNLGRFVPSFGNKPANPLKTTDGPYKYSITDIYDTDSYKKISNYFSKRVKYLSTEELTNFASLRRGSIPSMNHANKFERAFITELRLRDENNEIRKRVETTLASEKIAKEKYASITSSNACGEKTLHSVSGTLEDVSDSFISYVNSLKTAEAKMSYMVRDQVWETRSGSSRHIVGREDGGPIYSCYMDGRCPSKVQTSFISHEEWRLVSE